MPFIRLRKSSSFPRLLNVFIMKRCWILSSAFSMSIEMITWFLFCILLIQCDILIDFQVMKQADISGWPLHWSWHIILFIHCWILFASILLEIFISIFIRDINLYFFVISLSGFDIRIILASWWVGKWSFSIF